MAKMMTDEQRAQVLEDYNPKEHLIQVGKDRQGQVVFYYPAAWRLYELHLRYPNANFRSEILFHDEVKGTIIVKACLYLGRNYEESDKKAEAMKQGNITTLDKVETAAKARCARDFGIGTEYALDMEPDETDATHDTSTATSERKASSSSSSKAQVTPPVALPVTRPTPVPAPTEPKKVKLATSAQIAEIADAAHILGPFEWRQLLPVSRLPEDTSQWSFDQATMFLKRVSDWTGSDTQKAWFAGKADKTQMDEITRFRSKEQYGGNAVASLKSRIESLKEVSSTDFTHEQADTLLNYLYTAKPVIEQAKRVDPANNVVADFKGITHPLDFYATSRSVEEGTLEDYLKQLNEIEARQAA